MLIFMKNNYGEKPDSVGFGEAISVCFKKYFVFEGRATQSEYWYFLLFCIILYIPAVFLSSFGSVPLTILGSLLMYGTVIPQVSVSVRRMHDTNRSGWYLWIPIYNLIIVMFFDSSTKIDKSNSTSKTQSIKKNLSKSNLKLDITDDLENLEELYNDGTLSEAQFKQAKKKLLE